MAAKKIAVLSGKGGTGKTLVSVNLAAAARNAYYVDCDVEEPNGHLFFKPEIINQKDVLVKIPQVDNSLCTGCQKCVNFCKFNALAYSKQVIIFEDVCHSCGGCSLVCPTKAISEKEKPIGIIQQGFSGSVQTITGIMNMGEISGVPIIREQLKIIQNAKGMVFIDCPPGTACVAMESISDADYCVLVAEPTMFGAHNLEMVYNLVKIFEKKCGVVLNKYQDSYNPSEDFCKKKGIKVLGKISFDKDLGTLNSEGGIAARESNKYGEIFSLLLSKVQEAAR